MLLLLDFVCRECLGRALKLKLLADAEGAAIGVPALVSHTGHAAAQIPGLAWFDTAILPLW